MTTHHQILASSRTAARMLDMTQAEFLGLVESGALPMPVAFNGVIERWRVQELERIATGETAPDAFAWE